MKHWMHICMVKLDNTPGALERKSKKGFNRHCHQPSPQMEIGGFDENDSIGEDD